jgi:mercuric ion transport protein
MKAGLGGIGAAALASACCIGPVVFSLIGAGAVGASAAALEPHRPWLIGQTFLLVGFGFYQAYRPLPTRGCADGSCLPASRVAARVLAWTAALLSAALIAFPYYVGWLV